jgi:hypothetical protein
VASCALTATAKAHAAANVQAGMKRIISPPVQLWKQPS